MTDASKNLLQDIPVPDNPLVLFPEYVHDCHSPVPRLPDKIAGYYHETAVSDKPFDLGPEPEKRTGKSVHECGECRAAVCSSSIMVPVVGPGYFPAAYSGFLRLGAR